MIALNIFLGLLGLGIVVFVHELGHFLAAKAVGISVEAFSIGWGPKILSYKRGETEYRLSLFLFVGGYCKMRGEELFRHAIEHDEQTIPHEKGSLFSVGPWRRIAAYLAGPAANFLFAILALSVLWYAGFTITSYDAKVILASDNPVAERTDYPSDRAGMKTGDEVVAIDGEAINHYRDLQEVIATSPERDLVVTVRRDANFVDLLVRPELDKETGSGLLGVRVWIDPVIDVVEKDRAAYIAGLQYGDNIVEAAGVKISSEHDLAVVLSDRPERLPISVMRSGVLIETTLLIPYDENNRPELGFSFQTNEYRSEKVNIFGAIGKGAEETVDILTLSIRSIGLLFKGINVGNAVSGPIRITYILGEVASQSFKMGIGTGFTNSARFLSLLSVALFFMNLLPIPALDGGHILLALTEAALRKQVKPRLFYRYQLVGFFIIVGLLLFTTFNDISFFVRN